MRKTVTSRLRAEIPALVLFAHGARDPEWALPFQRIRRTVAAKRAGTAVELAFHESMEPTLAAAAAKLAAAGHQRIVVAPLFMAQGSHLKRDLPRIIDALRAEHPGTAFDLLPAIGEVDAVLDAISDWLASEIAR